MSLTRSIALAATLAAGLASSATGQSADTVVARVNGIEITLGHMIVLYERLPEEYRELPPEQLYDGILEQLVQQTALGSAAEDLSPRSLLMLENEERALRAQEVLSDAAETAVNEDAVQAFYDDAFAGADAELEYNANHILVETLEEAESLKAELDAGADFEEMAREHSIGPSGPNGGELGWFGQGMMVAEFEEAVIALDPGTVSDPIQTQFGWHLVKLNEVRDREAPALDEVRDQIEEQLRQTTIDALVDTALTSSTIERQEQEIDPSLLRDQSLLAE